jgi:hypothetical protein
MAAPDNDFEVFLSFAKRFWPVLLAIQAGLTTVGGLFFRLWLETRFKKQLGEIEHKRTAALEDLKHEHTKTIEDVKHERTVQLETTRSGVQKIFSRISKVHEKEFEVLPKAWLQLNEALGNAAYVISPMREAPSMEQLTDQLENFLSTLSFLTEAQKNELRNADNAGERVGIYRQIVRDHELKTMLESVRDLSNYLIEHRIFMSEQVFEAFDKAFRQADKASSSYVIALQYNLPDMHDEARKAIKDRVALLNDVLSAIKLRLGFDKA